jgi:hypothetical protein
MVIEEHVVCPQGGAHISNLILWKELPDLWRAKRSHDKGWADDVDRDILIFEKRRADASTQANTCMLRGAVLRINRRCARVGSLDNTHNLGKGTIHTRDQLQTR